MGIVVGIKSWEISPKDFYQHTNAHFTQGPAGQLVIIINEIHSIHKKKNLLIKRWKSEVHHCIQKDSRDAEISSLMA